MSCELVWHNKAMSKDMDPKHRHQLIPIPIRVLACVECWALFVQCPPPEDGKPRRVIETEPVTLGNDTPGLLRHIEQRPLHRVEIANADGTPFTRFGP